MIRKASILLAALALAGCTTPASGLKKGDTPPTLPGSQYKLEAESAPEQIALAQHPDGLSDHQRGALNDYARGYIEAGGEQVTIKTPAHGGEAALRMAYAAKAALEASGLHGGEVVLGAYDADKPDAPVLISYDRWRAKPIECGRKWENLTASRDNQPQSNFGCAITANMAAQMADPRDIRSPHAADAADAARRGTVLDNYRKGELTASKREKEMSGNISQAVQ